MKVKQSRAAAAPVAVVLLVLVVLAGCTRPSSSTVSIGPSDVASIDVYLYAYERDPDTVTVSHVEDRREIEEIVGAFTDMPITARARIRSDLPGARTAGLRFHLRAGGTVELTQVFVEPGDVVVFWPDGTIAETTWGSAVGDLPTPSDPAANRPSDATQVPRTAGR